MAIAICTTFSLHRTTGPRNQVVLVYRLLLSKASASLSMNRLA
jgi:hypothetical protein